MVSAKKSGVLVTGFVQTDGLVQSVNAAQLAPYDEAQVVDGTKALLAELAERACNPWGPFLDPQVLRVYDDFERAVYAFREVR